MSQSLEFKSCLVTLRRRQNVGSLLVGKLGQSSGVHGSTPLLLCFQHLSRLASIDNDQNSTGIDRFQYSLDVQIRQTAAEYREATLQINLLGVTFITQVVRNQVITIASSCAVSGKVNEHRDFRFDGLQRLYFGWEIEQDNPLYPRQALQRCWSVRLAAMHVA